MRVTALFLVPCLVLLLAQAPAPAHAFVFVAPEPPLLAKELAGADVVVFGRLYHTAAGAEKDHNTTAVAILAVIKDHEGLKDKKHFTLKRYVPVTGSSPMYFVLFGEVRAGEIDVYRGIPCSGKDDEIVEYLKNIRQQEKASRVDELAFYFGHLEHLHPEVAQDALGVFFDATYADLRRAARRFDIKKLEGWIADKKVPERRKELYRVLLVLCQHLSDR
jgi:hypothetical protein